MSQARPHVLDVHPGAALERLRLGLHSELTSRGCRRIGIKLRRCQVQRDYIFVQIEDKSTGQTIEISQEACDVVVPRMPNKFSTALLIETAMQCEGAVVLGGEAKE